MFDKALTLVLFGVLFMSAATVTYGTFYDQGFAPSVAGVLGLADGRHDADHREHDND